MTATTKPRLTAMEAAAEAIPVGQLHFPRDLTDLPHGVYARAVRHHIDPLWGLAGDEPELWADLEDAVREAGLTSHEPPMAEHGSVYRLEEAVKPELKRGPTATVIQLIEDVKDGGPFAYCDECGEPHDHSGPTCDCADQDDEEDEDE